MDQNETKHAGVEVIGYEAKIKSFSGHSAVGDSVRINGVAFQVIGVLEPKMQEGDDNINRAIYIPFSAIGDLKDTRYLDGIWVDYESMEYEKIEDNIRAVVAGLHGFNPTHHRAIFVFNAMKQVNTFDIITLGLQVLLTFIGTLTLGIGAVGLMNITPGSTTHGSHE